MKRRLMCMLLVAVLACCVGCTPENKLAGSWTAEVDALQTVLPSLPAGLASVQLGALPVTVVLTLTQEGTFTLSVQQETIRKAIEDLWDRVEELLGDTDGDAQGITASLEGILGAAADKLKESLRKLLEDARIEEKITTAYTRSGTYDYDGKQLLLTDGEGDTFLTSKCLLLGDKLTLTAPFPGVALLTFQKNKE